MFDCRLFRFRAPRLLVAFLLVLAVSGCSRVDDDAAPPPASPGHGAVPVFVEGSVSSTARQPDGKVLVGGSFDRIGGKAIRNLARLEADGTVDASFVPDPDGGVSSVVVQADGKVVLGGYFTKVGGATRFGIARVAPSGALDNAYTPELSWAWGTGRIHAMALDSAGRVVVGGGDFRTIGGQPRNFLARLGSTGTVDASFDPAPDDRLQALAIDGAGRILAGGYFTQIGGTTQGYLARLTDSGAIDNTFAPAPDRRIQKVAIDASGKIYVAGGFGRIGGGFRNGLARLAESGSLDDSFDVSVDGYVRCIAPGQGGTVAFGGSFASIGGSGGPYAALLDSAGIPVPSFTYVSATDISAILLMPDGRMIFGENARRG